MNLGYAKITLPRDGSDKPIEILVFGDATILNVRASGLDCDVIITYITCQSSNTPYSKAMCLTFFHSDYSGSIDANLTYLATVEIELFYDSKFVYHIFVENITGGKI